jgi:DNA polymerase-2
MTLGWIFDAYPLGDKMIFWIKQKDGKMTRLEDKWTQSIYVASDDKPLLKSILNKDKILSLVEDFEFISKNEKLTDDRPSQVLQLKLKDSSKALTLALEVEKMSGFGQLRLYNVDVPPAQSYFYEHDIFPLAYCQIDTSNLKLKWNFRDNVWSTDYELPNFKRIHLRVLPRVTTGKIPKLSDNIDHIEIEKYCKNNNSNESIEIVEDNSEVDILDQLAKEVTDIDPDFILTDDGDSFTFPYLIERSNCNGVELNLNREKTIPLTRPERQGTSYFSYGRIFFKHSTIKLLGRIHIDTDNSFVIAESGLQGLYELSRICRMPLHTASRASIGKCMSSLQFYHATKNDTLIPWKPTLSEHPKNLEQLLIADRGGMIYEPIIGTYEKVVELDFISLYPSIMRKMNISAETILCNCCLNSKLKVPQLVNYYRCEKRKGIVPISLEILLTKRKWYKELRNSVTDSKLREIYDSRQNALKWILVTSFGYLGFNNAKFGRIDAHIAVCAFDRQILLQAIRIAERHGFGILHAIVDSIWIYKKKEKDKYENDCLKLKDAIELETGFEISLEGIFKWIAFLPSKSNDMVGVPNRYFGAYEDGTLKIRGIEARRHDTPSFLSNYQQIILNIMAEANNVRDIKGCYQ